MQQIQRSRAKTRAATRGVLSHALILLTLLAFALQGYVTQTHIHVSGSAAPGLADLFDGKPGPAKDNAPSKNDPANCPLCQEFASAGHFVTPAALAILLPALAVSVIDIAIAPAHDVPAVTHIWRGRAPPRG
jgi:hypothetical protein